MSSQVVLKQGDCLEVMRTLPNKSVDMVLCDLPYGTTSCAWDAVIPFDPLWAQYKRIVKDGCAIVLTASQPFTSALVMSNPAWFKYEWIWKKNAGSNFGTVKYQPMKEHESVLVFGNGKVRYFPQMQERAESGKRRVKTVVNYDTSTEIYGGKQLKQDGNLRPELRYPSSVQPFNRERGRHPTQKPVPLFEYLVRTYSQEGDVVLDNCLGSGTTAIACLNAKRKCIGIELNPVYFEAAKKRVSECESSSLW